MSESPIINIDKIDQLNYYKAICLFAAGYSKKEILSTLKISERTLQHWFQKQPFRDTLNDAIGIVFRGVLSKAVTFASEGIDILIDISRDESTPTKYRIQAIQTIFDILLKSGANYTLEDKLQRETQAKVDRIASYTQLQDAVSMVISDEDDREEKVKSVWGKLFPSEEYPENLLA